MNKNYRLPATVCALAVCLTLCFAVAAWKSPGGVPPAGNAAAPINAGSEAQYKTGGLGVKIGGAITYWISQIGNNLVFKTGDDFNTATETVNINVDGRIGNVSAPIDDKDAVNKAYLDAQSGGGAGYGTCSGSFLDIKFTSAEYTGNLGGVAGATAKCAAEYPGYHICRQSEFEDAGRRGCLPNVIQYFLTTSAGGGNGGWLDTEYSGNSCVNLTNGEGYTNFGSLITISETWEIAWNSYLCVKPIHIACCKEF